MKLPPYTLDEILQPRTGVFYGLHLETDGGELVGDGHDVRVGVERRLEP